MSVLSFLAGAALLGLAAADLFLVVLHLSGGAGLVTPWASEATWRLLRASARAVPGRRDAILSFSGPLSIVALAVLWGVLVLSGSSLLVWPLLGDAIVASSGPTPTGFGAAVYVAGMNLTTLGIGDLVPLSVPARLLTVAMAALGFSLLTLVVTYVLSVYSALLRRNTFALDLHHRTASEGDAAHWVVHGMAGDGASLRQDLGQAAQELVHVYESHQFYPVLHYFRYPNPHASLARMLLVVADAHALATTALDPDEHRALVRGLEVRAVREAALGLAAGLAETFLPDARIPGPSAGDVPEALEARWRERYRRVRDRLAREGVAVADADEGEAAYLALRREWEPWVETFARRLDYEPELVFADGTR